MPVLPGSVRLSPAATATAASAQFPPLRRISRPHWVASGCVLDTMPLVLWTTERRDENAANRGGTSQGLKAELFNGMFAAVVYDRVKNWEMRCSLPSGAVRVFLNESVLTWCVKEKLYGGMSQNCWKEKSCYSRLSVEAMTFLDNDTNVNLACLGDEKC